MIKIRLMKADDFDAVLEINEKIIKASPGRSITKLGVEPDCQHDE